MKMLINVVPALLVPLASSALADTEFEGSVPLEVALQFVNNAQGGQGKLYSDIVADFPPFTLPSDFTVLASADQGYVQRVILRTTLDTQAALAAASSAFAGSGWVTIPDPGAAQTQIGFITRGAVPQFQQVCHDDYGPMMLSVTALDAISYVSVTRNLSAARTGMQPSCAQLLDPAGQGYPAEMMRSRVMMGEYAPRLVMPEAARLPANVRGGIGGGGATDWETGAMLNIAWDIDELSAHFHEQIEEQGWERDSEVTGDVAASSSWTKTTDDMQFIGTLTIVEQAQNNWDLKFRMVRVGNAAP